MLGPSRLARLATATVTATRAAAAAQNFSTSARRLADAPLPAKRPVGAFRSGLFGFLFGSVLAGGAAYSYLLQEYKASNDLLTEDVYTLQASVTRLTNYVKALEARIQEKK